jgi:uncharacterized tellurite resistance protein B-like protein
MLASLKQYFDTKLAPLHDAERDPRRLQVAAAALLVEVMRLDGASEHERRAVLDAVRTKFALSDEDAAEIAALAEEEVRESVGYYQFTSLINRTFALEQKVRLVELMWRVAYADATLSAHEQHVIRKIADLLHVGHGDYIAAKLRAKTQQG